MLIITKHAIRTPTMIERGRSIGTKLKRNKKDTF